MMYIIELKYLFQSKLIFKYWYFKGYIRQPLYACKSCCGEGVRAAICLACSLHCHEGHELTELYTKRHTKCDCGNSKFGDKSCSLEKVSLHFIINMNEHKFFLPTTYIILNVSNHFSLNLLRIMKINIIRTMMVSIALVLDRTQILMILSMMR